MEELTIAKLDTGSEFFLNGAISALSICFTFLGLLRRFRFATQIMQLNGLQPSQTGTRYWFKEGNAAGIYEFDSRY
jgi:hypothetical protein